MSDAFQRAFQGDAFQIGAPPAASGNKVLAADSASVTVTGTAASLERGYLVSAAAASVTATGTAASLFYGREVSAESASVTASGQAATLSKTWILGAAAGGVTVTGTDASLEYGRVLKAIEDFVFVNFTDGQMLVNDSTTPANNFKGDFTTKFTVTGTLTPGADGVYIDASNYATLALSNLPAGIVNSAATIVAEFMIPSLTGVTQTIVTIDGGNTNNRGILFSSSAGNSAYEMRSGAVVQANDTNMGAVTAGAIQRIAMAMTLNDANGAFNGTIAGAADASCTYPVSMTTLRLGRASNILQLDGYLRSILITARRATDDDTTAATAAYSIIAPLTSGVNVSTQAATLRKTWILGAAAGAVTVSGQNAALLYDYKLTAEAANVTVTGEEVTLTHVEVEQVRQGGGWLPAEYDEKAERKRRKKRKQREDELDKAVQAAFNAAKGIVPRSQLPPVKSSSPAMARELAAALAEKSDGSGREFAELRRVIALLRKQAALVDELSAHVAEENRRALEEEEEAIVMMLLAA